MHYNAGTCITTPTSCAGRGRYRNVSTTFHSVQNAMVSKEILFGGVYLFNSMPGGSLEPRIVVER